MRFPPTALLLVALPLAVLLPPAAPAAAQPAPPTTGAPAPGATLDLDDPEDAVRALRKLMCSLRDGEEAVYYFEGDVYSRIPGERDRHLFTYQAYNVRACTTTPTEDGSYGYRMVSRELLFYQDPGTGEILRTWTNPWSGEEVEILHVANDPVNQGPVLARGPRGPFRLGVEEASGRGWLRFDVPLFYTNPLGGPYQDYVGGTYQAIELFNFFFDHADLLDASRDAASATSVGWSRVSQFLPWMKMGGRVGYVVFSGAGTRLDGGWAELPENVREEVLRNHPDYVSAPPLDDTRPNATSWTVFKEWIDAQRAAGGR